MLDPNVAGNMGKEHGNIVRKQNYLLQEISFTADRDRSISPSLSCQCLRYDFVEEHQTFIIVISCDVLLFCACVCEIIDRQTD